MKVIKWLGVLVAAAGLGLLAVAVTPSALAQSSRRLPEAGPETHDQRDTDRRLTTLHGRRGPEAEIGVSVRDLRPAELKAAHGEGVAIEEVEGDGPAARAGLQASDLVVSFDGERVRSARQFARLVAETAPGRPVKAAIVRSGQRKELEITPKEREAFAFALDMGRLRDRLGDLSRYAERIPPMDFELDFDGWPGARERLGITTGDLGDQLATYFGAKDGGVLVAAVRDGSPAARAGLQAGDVIASVNGEAVRSRHQLFRALRAETREGRTVTFGVIRDKKAMTVKVEASG